MSILRPVLAPVLLPAVMSPGDPRLALVMGGGGGAFAVRGVTPADEFDVEISGSLLAPDGPVLSSVLWFRKPVEATQAGMFSAGGVYISLDGNDTGSMSAEVAAANGEGYFGASGTSRDDVWDCYLIKARTDHAPGAKIIQIYRRDLSVAADAYDEAESFNINLSNDPYRIQIPQGVGVAEVWVSADDLDFSVEAVRRKFFDADGKPVDLGADGSAPNGSPPLAYLSVRQGDSAAAILENRAGGPAWSVTSGTLSLAGTSPSD